MWLWQSKVNWGSASDISVVTFKMKARVHYVAEMLQDDILTAACVMSAYGTSHTQCFASATGRSALEALGTLQAKLEELVGRTLRVGDRDLGTLMPVTFSGSQLMIDSAKLQSL